MKNVFLGGISTSISKTMSAPIERVKFFLQTQYCLDNINPKFKGINNCFINIIKTEGFFSLWRGNLINVIRVFPTQGFNFAFNDYFNNLIFSQFEQKNKSKISIYKHFIGSCLSGGLSGAATLSFVYPLDLIRTRLALDYGKRKFTSAHDCFQQIYKKDSIVGLYRGFGISIFGIVQYRALFFGGYDLIKSYLRNKNITVTLFFLQKFQLLPFLV